MKKSLIVLSILTLGLAAAAEARDYCDARLKLEAQIELAKSLGEAASATQVVEFDAGAWTELPYPAVNTKTAVVRVSGRQRRHIIAKTYAVAARSNGVPFDCTVASIEEASEGPGGR